MSRVEELNAIWQEVKETTFSPMMPSSSVSLWFDKMTVIGFENNTIQFEIDTPFKYQIVCEKYMEKVKEGFRDFLGFDIGVELRLADGKDNVLNEPLALTLLKQRTASDASKSVYHEYEDTKTTPEPQEFGSELLPYHFEYTFDNFIVGSSNKFAHAACLAVADNPAFTESVRNDSRINTYNPLFIYGQSGLGKTHLLHAIVNRISQKLPGAKILYIKGDDFTNQLIEHLSRGTMNAFKEKYRKCDVLLIDDIQFIAGKESTQEEFFHTFNALYEEHKQIILTSDRPPREIKPLEDRLVTRFEWGLIADIQPPDAELRVAILKKKAEQAGITVPDDVLTYMADNLRSNIRQIEGAIKKLAALSFLSGREINIDLVNECLIELMGGAEPVSLKIDKVFTVASRHYGVSREDLVSEKRQKEIAMTRHIVIYMIRTITDMSFPNIARVFNKKNHTTILSSYQLIEKKIKNDPALAVEIGGMIKEITES